MYSTENRLKGHIWVHFPHRLVHCYLEFKLRYLKNLKLFSITVKESFEPIACIVLRKQNKTKQNKQTNKTKTKKQNKTKQNKTKQNKTKRQIFALFKSSLRLILSRTRNQCECLKIGVMWSNFRVFVIMRTADFEQVEVCEVNDQ